MPSAWRSAPIRFSAKAFERFLYYLGPTPKIVFFPVMIMWFGVGPESKIAMGTLSCFFPVVLSAAAGMRQIEGVLIRVGRSFRLNTWQMVTKIYLPAMREPIVNGVRLGMGVAMIGTLLAETKLSNKGIGFMIIDAYNTFDMPRMYAVLLMLFVIAIGANALVGRASRALVAVGRALAELLFRPDLKWPVDIGIGSLRFVHQFWVPAVLIWHLYVTIMRDRDRAGDRRRPPGLLVGLGARRQSVPLRRRSSAFSIISGRRPRSCSSR